MEKVDQISNAIRFLSIDAVQNANLTSWHADGHVRYRDGFMEVSIYLIIQIILYGLTAIDLFCQMVTDQCCCIAFFILRVISSL